MRSFAFATALLLAVNSTAQADELYVASYNVENLFDTVDDPDVTSAAYAGIAGGKAKSDARKAALDAMTRRLADLIQRRHDCIHNCDRPKNVPQPIGNPGSIRNVIRDIRFAS